jgi:hypothetical protein
MIKKIIVLAAVLTILLEASIAGTYAAVGNEQKRDLSQLRENIQKNNQEKMDQLRAQVNERVQERIASTGAGLRTFRNGRIAIGSGELTAMQDSTLTLVKDGTTYTVLVDEQTQLRRKFWGPSDLSEFTVGDMLSIVGTWENEEKTTIRARMIKNLSIQMRHGVFFGTVTSLGESGFTMDSIRRGSQTVTVDAETLFINRRQGNLEFADILIGHRVRVRGLWNSRTSTITEVTQVKDFSLPEIAKPSGRPTATPTTDEVTE